MKASKTEFIEACQKKNLTQMRQLSPKAPKTLRKWEQLAMEEMIRSDNLEMVNYFLHKNIRISPSLLYMAIDLGKINILKALLEKSPKNELSYLFVYEMSEAIFTIIASKCSDKDLQSAFLDKRVQIKNKTNLDNYLMKKNLKDKMQLTFGEKE